MSADLLSSVPPAPRKPSSRTKRLIFAYRGAQKATLLISIGWLIITSIVWLGIVNTLAQPIAITLSSVPVQATLTKIGTSKHSSKKKNHTYSWTQVDLHFEYTIDQVVHHADESTKNMSWKSKYEKGDSILLDVSTMNPDWVQIHELNHSAEQINELIFPFLFVGAFVVVGVFLLRFAIRSNRREIQAFIFGEPAIGVIHFIGEDRSVAKGGKHSKKTYPYSIVQWKFKVNGTEHEGKLQLDYLIDASDLRMGQKIVVLYDPKNPSINTIYLDGKTESAVEDGEEPIPETLLEAIPDELPERAFQFESSEAKAPSVDPLASIPSAPRQASAWARELFEQYEGTPQILMFMGLFLIYASGMFWIANRNFSFIYATLLGIGLMVLAFHRNKQKLHAFIHGVPTVGRITFLGKSGSSKRGRSNNPGYQLRWEFDVDDKVYTGKFSNISRWAFSDFWDQKSLIVLYDPRKPENNIFYVDEAPKEPGHPVEMFLRKVLIKIQKPFFLFFAFVAYAGILFSTFDISINSGAPESKWSRRPEDYAGDFIYKCTFQNCSIQHATAAQMQKARAEIQGLLPALQSTNAKARERALRSLHRQGSAALDQLEFFVEAVSDPDVRVRMEGTHALATLVQTDLGFKKILAVLKSSSKPAVRIELLRFLMDQDLVATKAVPYLLQALIEDPDPQFRAALPFALLCVDPRNPKVHAAIQGVWTAPEPEVRCAAILALGMLGNKTDAFKMTAEKGSTEEVPEVRQAMELAQNALLPKQAILLFAALMDSPSDLVRQAALIQFQFLPTQAPDVLPILVKALKDPKQDLRQLAAKQLQSFGPAAKPALGDLVAALQDPDPNTRVEAAKAIAAMDMEAKSALPDLRAAAKRYPSVRAELNAIIQQIEANR